MFYDKDKEHGRHKHGHRGHGGGRRGWHRGRKLSSDELQLLLLLFLKTQPSHGYELIKSLDERTQGFYAPSPGMIYPALTYLEEIGHAQVEAEGNKKRYRLTGEGADYLAEREEIAAELLAELERTGAQMSQARREWEESERDGAVPDELEDARRELRRAQRERAPFSAEEAARIAGILHRATTQIRGGDSL